MTSRDCFYCGKRVAAGKSCSVLFLDGRGYPPSDTEIIQYAQLCDTSDPTIKHDAGHAALRRGISDIACNSFACYRLLKDVNNYVTINVRVTRSIGEASTSTPILPAHRKVPSAAEKAAALEEPARFYPLGPRGGISHREVTLIHNSALEPTELHSLGAAPQQEEQSSPPSSRPWTPSPHTTDVDVEALMSCDDPSAQLLETVLSGTGRRKELSKYRPTSTLSAAQAQNRAVHLGSELHSTVKELDRVRFQYDKASAERKVLKQDAGRAELLHTELERELARSKQELSIASSRLEIFEQAAAVLADAGLGDIPERFAAGVLSSAIDTSSVFARFLDDQMQNVFHSTSYTHRFKDDVKTWLAAALAQPSTARAFETLAGNPKRRSQMGLMLPTARTLRDLYKTESAASASGKDFMGFVIPEQVKAFLKYMREVRRIEWITAEFYAVRAARDALLEEADPELLGQRVAHDVTELALSVVYGQQHVQDVPLNVKDMEDEIDAASEEIVTSLCIALSMLGPTSRPLLPVTGELDAETCMELTEAANAANVPSIAVLAAAKALRRAKPSVSPTVLSALGFDETDIDPMLYISKDGKYTFGGDVNLSVINEDDPAPLQLQFRKLMQSLDDTICSGKDGKGGLQAAIDELAAGVGQLRDAVRAAEAERDARAATYRRRNDKIANGTTVKKRAARKRKPAAGVAADAGGDASGTAVAVADANNELETDEGDALRDQQGMAAIEGQETRAAAELLKRRLVTRIFEDASEETGFVAEVLPEDSDYPNQIWFKIEYIGTDVQNFDELPWRHYDDQSGEIYLRDILVPMSAYASEDLLTRLAQPALLAEARARGLRGGKTTKPELARKLFSKFQELKAAAAVCDRIDVAVLNGDLTVAQAQDLRDAIIEDQQAEQLGAGQAAAGTGEADDVIMQEADPGAPGPSPEEAENANMQSDLEAVFKSKQVTELVAKQAVIDAAIRRLRTVTEFLVDARNAGYYVDALVLDEQRGEDDPGDSDSDALGLYIANRAIEAGLRGGWPQPVVSADTLIGLATRARILIAEVFEGRRKPANKILGFMLKDLKHLVSVHIATFAVDSKMTSATLDALVEYVLTELASISNGEINNVLETCDGAQTNLIRECRASKRTSPHHVMPGSAVPSPVDNDLNPPNSLREASIETNDAVERWKRSTEVALHEQFERSNDPQLIKSGNNKGARSSATKPFIRAMKLKVAEAWTSVALPTPPGRFPNLFGWLQCRPAVSGSTAVQGAGEGRGGKGGGEGESDDSYMKPTTNTQNTTAEAASAEAWRSRVLAKERAGARDPTAAALRGSSFVNLDDIQDPSMRRLFNNMAKLRPAKEPRPVQAKAAQRRSAAAAATAAAGLGPLLPPVSSSDVLLEPMPVMPTKALRGETLAWSVLASNCCSSSMDVDTAEPATAPLAPFKSVTLKLNGCPPQTHVPPVVMTTCAQQLLAEDLWDAVDDPAVSVADMLAELRLALHDRVRWELGKWHCIDLTNSVLVRKGYWLYQCPPHKYKRIGHGIKAMIEQGEKTGSELPEAANQFSSARLLRVVRELARDAQTGDEQKRWAAIDSVLTGGSDMHSQSAHVFLLICPQLLEELDKRPECMPEHTVLYALGMAWLAWDMKHLTDLERTRRIELVEALLVYNLGGEQLFMPFKEESTKQGTLRGVLSLHMGLWSMQNMLALLQNAAARRQFREQFPLEIFVERVASNNDIETYWSLIAGQIGYKPRLMELQKIAAKNDFLMRTLFDPTRRFYMRLSKKKMYDPVEYFTPSALLEWNDGCALDMMSPECQQYLRGVALRAIASSRGSVSTVRSQNTVRSNDRRNAFRNISGPDIS